MITQEELKNQFHYNPYTGIFIRKKLGKKTGSKNNCGYININVNNKTYSAHRLAWLYVHGDWPKNIDHVNHIRHDNRLVNLRNVTHKENRRNSSLISTNKSGVNGVHWNKNTNKWIACIFMRNGENIESIHLGSHLDKFEAICARMSANNKHGFHKNHGD